MRVLLWVLAVADASAGAGGGEAVTLKSGTLEPLVKIDVIVGLGV